MRHPNYPDRYPDRYDVLLHVGAFVVVALICWIFVPSFLAWQDGLTRATLSTLIAGVIVNAACSRWFGALRLADVGLDWDVRSARQAGIGLALGSGAMAALVGIALGIGLASLEQAEPGSATVPLLLLAAAVGEELLFRGYAFQYLVRFWPGATVVGSSLLFGLTHLLLNDHINLIGTLNTAFWGFLLGYAYCRTKRLWLPIGIHYGWNLVQVLLGAPLSGTTIRATGVQLQWTAGALWSGGAYGPEGGLLTTFAGVGVFLVLRRLRSTSGE